MESTIRFKNIVHGARLDSQTAQHVLRTPDILRDMPEGGSRGVYRRFTLAQAMRLAICTNLINAGMPLMNAGETVGFCEKRAKKFASARRGVRRFYAEVLDPWLLTIDERRYCRLWREGLAKETQLDENEFFDMWTEKWVERELAPIVRVQLNLTELEFRLWAQFPSDEDC